MTSSPKRADSDAARPSFVLQCNKLWTGVDSAFTAGWVRVVEGIVVETGRGLTDAATISLNDSAVIPGLVNAHTHLEFSFCAKPLGQPGIEFPDWIRDVIAWRMSRASGGDSAQMRADAIKMKKAIAELRAREIAAGQWQTADYDSGRVEILPYHEFLGLSIERSQAAWEALRQSPAASTRALSPHAPYTVAIEDLNRLCDDAQLGARFLAMHLAESLPEIELVEKNTGAFVEMLAGFGAWSPDRFTVVKSIGDYIEALSKTERSLVVHGNFLTDEQIQRIGRHRERLSVVYCPRTHHYFQLGNYPLVEMLDEGVRVVLGTDSRATNPDLSIWRELQFVARAFPDISGEVLLSMITTEAAYALGEENRFGKIAPGFPWRGAAVSLTDTNGSDDLRTMILDSAADPTPLWPAMPPDSSGVS